MEANYQNTSEVWTTWSLLGYAENTIGSELWASELTDQRNNLLSELATLQVKEHAFLILKMRFYT